MAAEMTFKATEIFAQNFVSVGSVRRVARKHLLATTFLCIHDFLSDSCNLFRY